MTGPVGSMPAQLQAVAEQAVARVQAAWAHALAAASDSAAVSGPADASTLNSPTAALRRMPALSQLPASSSARCLRVLALSPFVVDWAARHATAFINGVLGEFDTVQDADALTSELARALTDVDDDTSLKVTLRTWRARHQVGIIWRDLLCVNDLESTTAQLSAMAEVAVRATLAWCYAREVQQRGLRSVRCPLRETGEGHGRRSA